jgi:S1-C subfamily serine protease
LQNDEDDKESSVSIIKIYSDEIEEGMSGAPVLDLDANRVVGIISLHYPAKDNNVDTKLNFAIPVESIIKVCPSIKEKNPGLDIRR